MKPLCASLLALAGALSLPAQLTTAQKLADFQSIADQFAKRYVATQWKGVLFGVNAFDITRFLDRVKATTNDLDFYEVCVDYIAQFHDGGHVYFAVPSNFVADTGLRVDTFDGGKPLIYAINRAYLPAPLYPFQTGDELISVDGVTAADLMASLAKYGIRSNPRTEAGYAAQYTTYRPQSVFPHAVDLPDSSQLAIRRQSTGAVETYTVTWVKTGVPLRNEGPRPYPAARRTRIRPGPPPAIAAPPPPLTAEIGPTRGVTGIGAQHPVFNLPAGFKLRQGQKVTDPFYSGTYQAGGHTIGFIRIPSFNPAIGISAALSVFDQEIAYFNANTDGLIVDDMRNPGGIIYYGEEVARRLIPVPFHLVGFELQPTQEWVQTYSSYAQYEQAIGGPSYWVAYLQALLTDVTSAFANEGHTGPEPLDPVLLSPQPVLPSLDTTPATDTAGNVTAYTKPVMVLTDEFSFSTADDFPATMQDNQAAVIYGTRTSGLGGTNASYNGGAFSESSIGMLRGLMYRKNPVTVQGYPTTNYVENVGVQPDIADDYKTLDNLLHGGATFVSNFTAAMVKLIETGSAN